MVYLRSPLHRSMPLALEVLPVLCLLIVAFCFHTHLVAYLTSMWRYGHLVAMSWYCSSSLLHPLAMLWHIGPQMAMQWRYGSQTAMMWRGSHTSHLIAMLWHFGSTPTFMWRS